MPRKGGPSFPVLMPRWPHSELGWGDQNAEGEKDRDGVAFGWQPAVKSALLGCGFTMCPGQRASVFISFHLTPLSSPEEKCFFWGVIGARCTLGGSGGLCFGSKVT